MKKLILTLALIVTTAAYTMQAQRVSVNINIGSQPSWGPVGYDYVDYYYMPDIDCYYSVNQGLFFYLNAGRWVGVRYLPYTYRNYDFYSMYKVVLVGHDPWLQNNRHRRLYARYRGYHTQPVIRYSRDVRYRNSRNNDVIWYDRRSNDRRDNRYDRGRSDNGRYSNDKRDDSRYTNGRSNRVDNNRGDNKKNDRNRNDNRRPSDNGRSQGTRDNSKGDNRSSKSGQSSGSYYTQTSSRGGDRTSNSSSSRTSSTQSSRSSSSRSDRR